MSQFPEATDRTALLFRLSQTFNSTLDLDTVLNTVIDEVIAAIRAERGFVMLRERDGRLVFRAARGLDRRTIEAPEFQISRGLVERVVQEGQPRLASDAQSDEWLRERTSVWLLGLRSILCVPLQVKRETIGAIYVDNRFHAGIFTEADLQFLSAIAASAAIAIENARLYQVAVDQGRLERELQVARAVQASLLPAHPPRFEGWDIATSWQPMRGVAGDYFDFILSEDGRQLGLVIGDVTDKGMPAALFMALTRSTVRASVARGLAPAESITHANRLIAGDSTNGMFVTLFYGCLDLASGDLAYVNAGHNPPMLYRANQRDLIEFERTGMALGVFAENTYGEQFVALAPGDLLFLYTDGITDAMNAAGEPFGRERLREVVAGHCDAASQELLAAVEAALSRFTDAAAPIDDITMMAVRRLDGLGASRAD
jgi:serine phosphatase RsbU (regulator of sigma subunit)